MKTFKYKPSKGGICKRIVDVMNDDGWYETWQIEDAAVIPRGRSGNHISYLIKSGKLEKKPMGKKSRYGNERILLRNPHGKAAKTLIEPDKPHQLVMSRSGYDSVLSLGDFPSKAAADAKAQAMQRNAERLGFDANFIVRELQ